MLLILFTKNLLLLLNNIYNFIKIIKKKAIKDIFLFILFYLFFNLYLFPDFALCEIDLNLLDRENNTYRGSKIVYETPTQIITEVDLDYARGVCDMVVKICAVGFVITFSLYLYLLSTDK